MMLVDIIKREEQSRHEVVDVLDDINSRKPDCAKKYLVEWAFVKDLINVQVCI